MNVIFHLFFLTNCALLDAYSTLSVEEINCEHHNSLKWLWNLRNNNRCLSIVTSLIIPKCFFDQVFNSKFVIRTISPRRLLIRNIFDTNRLNCDNFFIFSKNVSFVNEIFQQRQDEKRFWPYSQIYLATPETVFNNDTIGYIHKNALNVFLMERVVAPNMDTRPFSFKSMMNVLTKNRFVFTSNLSDAMKYFGVYKDHPLLSTKSSDKIFRVGLFKCPPYVVYLAGNNEFGGLEFRILSEITSPWTIQPTKCDISNVINDPWSTVLKNVNNGSTDLAMCSVWLNSKTYGYYDATNYIDYQCGTFLVPKPKLVNPAAYLWLSLGRNVWIAFILSFVSTSILMSLIARIGRRIIKKSWNDKVYIDFSRSLLDAMNVATTHGIEKFPKQESTRTLFTRLMELMTEERSRENYFISQLDLMAKKCRVASFSGLCLASWMRSKIVFFHFPTTYSKRNCLNFTFIVSWIILSLIIGVAYTTGYTSFLTSPISTKPVDTLVDFLQNGLQWSVVSGPNTLAATFNATGVTNLVKLSQRAVENSVPSNGNINEKNSLFVKIITNRFITDINTNTDPTYSLRIMKSCLLNYYSVVAFKKYSGYTKYFNEKIRAYTEFGLIEHWALKIKGANNDYMKPYFLTDGKTTDGPTQLTITTLTGAFTLLGIGSVLAAAVFLGEHLLSALNSNKIRFKVDQSFSWVRQYFPVLLGQNNRKKNYFSSTVPDWLEKAIRASCEEVHFRDNLGKRHMP